MTEGPAETLNLTEYAQPAIFINSFLSYEKLKRDNSLEEKNVKYLFGHSVGEYTALCVAGSLSAMDTSKLLRFRGAEMQKASVNREGCMYAVLKDYEEVKDIVEKYQKESSESGKIVDVAAINSPKQFVLSGDLNLISKIVGEFKTKSIKSVKLNVSCAFHSRILSSMKPKFAEFLYSMNIAPPKKRVIRNLDLEIYSEKDDIIYGLVEQIDHPVLFQQTVNYCALNQITHFYDN